MTELVLTRHGGFGYRVMRAVIATPHPTAVRLTLPHDCRKQDAGNARLDELRNVIASPQIGNMGPVVRALSARIGEK